MKLILCSFVVLMSTLRPPSMNPKLLFLFELCYDFIIFTVIFVIQIPCQSVHPETSFSEFGARERLWVNWSRHPRVELPSDLFWSNIWYVYVMEKIVSDIPGLSEWSKTTFRKKIGSYYRIFCSPQWSERALEINLSRFWPIFACEAPENPNLTLRVMKNTK